MTTRREALAALASAPAVWMSRQRKGWPKPSRRWSALVCSRRSRLPMRRHGIKLSCKAFATIAGSRARTSACCAVAIGVVSNLAHPGGNITGYSLAAPEVIAKRVALLHEMLPAPCSASAFCSIRRLLRACGEEERSRPIERPACSPSRSRSATPMDWKPLWQKSLDAGGRRWRFSSMLCFLKTAPRSWRPH